MNAGKGKRDMGKSIEMHIAGHPVRLSFAKEADTTVAQRVRNSLIDAYHYNERMDFSKLFESKEEGAVRHHQDIVNPELFVVFDVSFRADPLETYDNGIFDSHKHFTLNKG